MQRNKLMLNLKKAMLNSDLLIVAIDQPLYITNLHTCHCLRKF